MRFTLYPQQVVFEDTIRNAFRSHRRVLGVASTGFGKSVVMADMAFKAVHDKHLNVLAVTNRRAIVFQLSEQCQNAGIDVGIVMGGVERDSEAPMQIASIQTLQRRGYSNVKTPGFLIIDEAHQFNSEYKKLICDRFPSVPALGLTATPVGAGGNRIEHFETIVEPVKNSEAIAAGHLLRVHPYISPSEPDLGGINLKTVSKDELGNRVEACTIYGNVFDEWKPYSHMQTMVMLPSRAVCNQFHKIALSRGIDAKIVDGTTPTDERNDTFSEFKEMDCQMLLGVDVIAEGLDLPIAQCLIDLHPTHQMRRYWQAVGRVKRPHEGQESAVVIDLAGNLWRHMVHPDEDPPWNEITSENTIEEVIERKAGVRCPECGSKDIYSIKGLGYKCEDCKHEWKPSKPWVCPKCRQGLGPYQKVVGGVCPNCGEKVGRKQTRQIRMTDGSYREVPAHEVKRRKKTKANRDQATWDKWRYIAHNTGKKLTFAKAMYQKETGKWPDGEKLKNCPKTANSGDWKRKPSEVYPWMNR